jgi:heme oxygenase
MSNLKELTWEHHKEAERQDFVKVMMSGNINPKFYATYLWNQHKKYDLLEAMATAQGCLDGIPEVKRKLKIEADFLELWTDDEMPKVVPSTKEYVEHMKTIMHDPEKLMAHIYVLHMGDLSGGQIIRKRIPGSGTMYDFDAPIDELKEKIRVKINDDMAEEAKFVFQSSTQLFKDLMELDIEHYLESSDPVSE